MGRTLVFPILIMTLNNSSALNQTTTTTTTTTTEYPYTTTTRYPTTTTGTTITTTTAGCPEGWINGLYSGCFLPLHQATDVNWLQATQVLHYIDKYFKYYFIL